ncbi:hypothetical protein CAFE_04040 [Caprobacter fermentans]|uniref:Flagellar hook capping protein n=1 Tax=Caproicibacter fermentans TaxID=2576756 RepID=A0A6N8HVN2_9FIRM|nr:flagellar hook capping FlgD N-terminal domain-containing protein [Caproicibacter fermentans]MVB09739.1 hypothetical protein [Caproicibacter fermentans]OCN03147.1 hypothetical protein A7X67_13525 [Clostridium sp. W14A]QNK42376.1 hypothetical protein HCR03_09295 [Caproicibacter fermentans]
MDNLGITGYGTLGRTYASGLESSANNSKTRNPSDSSLDMNDFLQLLAAQFQNQDVMNPTDNTEFISELAQFSSLQAMSELTTYSERQYASTLVGKTVEVGTYDTAGKYAMKKGVVESTAFGSDGCGILLEGDNTAYKLTDVVMVLNDSGSSGDSSGSGSSDGGSAEK